MSLHGLLVPALLHSLRSSHPAPTGAAPTAPRRDRMIWKNAQCELLLKNGQALGVTAQGAVLGELVPRLPLPRAEVRPLFGASRQLLALYADRKRYKAHIAAIRDYLARGGIRCRFEDLAWAKDADGKGTALLHALVLLTNADGDERGMHLSGRPAKGDIPVCLLLDVDEIEPSWTCNVPAFCIGDAIADIRSREPEDPQGATDTA